MPSHDERIRSIVSRFRTVQDQLIKEIEAVNEDAASRKGADAGWSPAQIGVHVAITNEWLAGAVSGTQPGAEPAPADFIEPEWSSIPIPARIKTFPQLEPPADATRSASLERLRSSGEQVVGALESLTPERARYCVALPFATISLYQMGEFAGAHVERHLGQLQRTLAPA
jgi:hypothetical protein